jgi:two-component system phosphate regulon response regulator OmpR
MPDSATILVVDDDLEVREMLHEYLTKRGFVALTADGGESLRRMMAEHAVDVVVLDRRMPGEDGLSLVRFLREHYAVGIVMLTAASEIGDRIVGLEIGADDYVTKPFDPRELLARIHSVLRRIDAAAATESAVPTTTTWRIRFGCCTLDLGLRQLFTLAGDEVHITPMEFDLLQTFATHPNQILTRDELLDMAHHRGWEPFDRSIDLRVARLRRKIEIDPTNPQTLKTVRGAGYMFVPHHDG